MTTAQKIHAAIMILVDVSCSTGDQNSWIATEIARNYCDGAYDSKGGAMVFKFWDGSRIKISDRGFEVVA